jgi:hypothetical protein
MRRRWPSNKWGLRHDEEDIAVKAIPDRSDVRLTREQKIEMYARNKARLQQMRASGQYDDQSPGGRIFKGSY